MLVITRKEGQSIMIGDEVEVVIVEVLGKKVKVGIKAQPEVRVYRDEIYPGKDQK